TICAFEGTLYEPTGRDAARTVADLWERAGERGLETLRGDFWVLLWDRERRSGVAVADPMGAHAPYWAAPGGRVVIASDVPDVLALLDRTPGPDPVAMAHWLAVTLGPGGRSLYEGVRRLDGGALLALEPGAPPRARRWWAPRH